jgi:hypothetical protein
MAEAILGGSLLGGVVYVLLNSKDYGLDFGFDTDDDDNNDGDTDKSNPCKLTFRKTDDGYYQAIDEEGFMIKEGTKKEVENWLTDKWGDCKGTLDLMDEFQSIQHATAPSTTCPLTFTMDTNKVVTITNSEDATLVPTPTDDVKTIFDWIKAKEESKELPDDCIANFMAWHPVELLRQMGLNMPATATTATETFHRSMVLEANTGRRVPPAKYHRSSVRRYNV